MGDQMKLRQACTVVDLFFEAKDTRGGLDLAVLFEQTEQKSSVLEHLCWRTPEYSIFQGGEDRTVT